MKFFVPKTFWEAMLPVTLVKWTLGMQTIKYPGGHPRRTISICWTGLYIILCLYLMWTAVPEYSWDSEKSMISKTSIAIIIMLASCSIALSYVSQSRTKDVLELFHKLDDVNKLLDKFGVPKEYELTSKSQIIHLIGAISLTLTVTVLLLAYDGNDLSARKIGIMSLQYAMLVCFIEGYTFSVCIRYIGKRFQHLNTFLFEISITDKYAMALPQNLRDQTASSTSMTPKIRVRPPSVRVTDKLFMIRTFKKAKEIHNDLCNIARNINKAFGIQILISMTLAMGVIIYVLLKTYNFLSELETTGMNAIMKIMVDLIAIGLCATKIIYLISACSMTSAEAQQSGEDIYQLVNPNTPMELREEIHAFSLQLMQDPLKFTACGFFNLDMAMSRTMVATITTYLVIMIQMPKTLDRINNTATDATIPRTKNTTL